MTQTYLRKLVATNQEMWNDKTAAEQPPLAQAQAFLNGFFVPFEVRRATLVDGMSPELKYYGGNSFNAA